MRDLDASGCLHSLDPWLASSSSGPALSALDDAEGTCIPPGLPPVTDCHVHLFPDRVFDAIWRWFESYGWPIRYKLYSNDILRFMFERGIQQVVGLCYSHKPGMADQLNSYMADLAEAEPRLWGLATVLPGEPGAGRILETAFARGLRGVKLHCHVQCFAPDDDVMEEIYRTCEKWRRPILMHAGREPSSPHYKCDTYEICGVDRVARVLWRHPELRLCIPHMGANEYAHYGQLLEAHSNLWLDTTMCLANYFPEPAPIEILKAHPNRILYGSDFPNLPYAWDRELKTLTDFGLSPGSIQNLLANNAAKLFGTI